jgi:hypothetical protein
MNPKVDFKAQGSKFCRAAKGQEGYGRFRLRNAPGDQAGTGAYSLGPLPRGHWKEPMGKIALKTGRDSYKMRRFQTSRLPGACHSERGPEVIR